MYHTKQRTNEAKLTHKQQNTKWHTSENMRTHAMSCHLVGTTMVQCFMIVCVMLLQQMLSVT